MKDTMRAALLTGIGRPLEIREVPVPRIGPDEVLIRTLSSGVCRTDLHIQDGLAYVPELPHIMGHEPAGVVVERGAAVSEVDVGEVVVPHLFVADGDCRFTRAGADAQALRLRGIIGVTLPGGFAEYFTAPARNLLKVPAGLDPRIAGLSSCAVVTAVHAYRRGTVAPARTAAVIGAGGIGQLLVQLLAGAGVATAAVDVREDNLALAIRNGAGHTASASAADRVPALRAWAASRDDDGADGVDLVIDLVGTSASMADAAQYVRRRGRIVVVGEEPDFPGISSTTLAQRELEIVGSRNGDRTDQRDALRLLAEGVITPPLDEEYPLERANEALARLRSGRANGRVLITHEALRQGD
ncbi:zinc-dependent alcohol dehydrogenase [Sphaerisporangium siamense]|uniref:Propanol-preferring alcohol dehydrogenase n=1 Tax=Sphaerisporangium siamense TaxID=795645 RepID=A0A7W7D6C2_9ACTN|nr:alcohol dehydrogenase catalytic domain-containing protein [Sphaerisporangium siamense]MBB4700160.1 propanol-preferring alcohol dehydrogenase [Sphaerisporangium siamense]GII84526.1 zinc-dependent alcohol dehydrogenase [Sphaerisporangium siamense]